MTTRKVSRVLPAVETLEGDGMIVRRPFPVAGIDQIDPFLLLDHLGPRDLAPGEARGAPDHPHRGFETVSYIIEGELEHEDSVGNHGVLGPGDVQWMTAGAGVVHSEMPSRRVQTEGGRLHGFQIWVNLPRAEKMTEPRYQEIRAERIPRAVLDDGRVLARVVAGDVFGVHGAVETHTPIVHAHLTVQPGASIEVPAPAGRNAMAYVFGGSAAVAGTDAPEGTLVVLDRHGDAFTLAVPATAGGPAEVLVLEGEPLGEPIFRYGPFVMNTKAEIITAIEDFQAGRLGAITR